MLITGLITFVVAITFWCVSLELDRTKQINWRLHKIRLFFPDSPTTAQFLSQEERVLAVERIRVNQTGVENKHFKKNQLVLIEFHISI
jgi:hypothetical protein